MKASDNHPSIYKETAFYFSELSLQDLLYIMFDDYARKQHTVKVLATYIPQQGPLENVCQCASCATHCNRQGKKADISKNKRLSIE
jgi:hypothetical protein